MIILSAAASSMEMVVCMCCAAQLFRHWKWHQDPTRLFLGLCATIFMLESLFKVISIAVYPEANLYSRMMDNTLIIFSLLGQIVAVVYPLFILYPRHRMHLTLLFIPWALLFVIYTAVPQWTLLRSFDDLLQHIGDGNVILRLVTLACFIPYLGFLFWIVPKRAQKQEMSLPMFRAYAFCVLLITFLHFCFFFTGNLVLHVLHQLSLAAFIFVLTIFDLEDRLEPSKTEEEPARKPAVPAKDEIMVSSEKPLWERIQQVMEQEDIWSDPSLSVESLARSCGTNVLYLGNSIKENTGWGANEYINRKRIGYVCQRLHEDPSLSLQDVFYEAGYRARTTAWRNFREIVGVSPSEYKTSKQ